MCSFQVCKSVKNKKKRARTHTHLREHDYTNQSTIYLYKVILVLLLFVLVRAERGNRTSISHSLCVFLFGMEFAAFRLPSAVFSLSPCWLHSFHSVNTISNWHNFVLAYKTCNFPFDFCLLHDAQVALCTANDDRRILQLKWEWVSTANVHHFNYFVNV